MPRPPLVATLFQHTAARRRLNRGDMSKFKEWTFQHAAARRRLGKTLPPLLRAALVSTHSRPKAAGAAISDVPLTATCFNTQPPEGGCQPPFYNHFTRKVSTHSRPKAAAPSAVFWAGWPEFQHTAARRRLLCSRQRRGRHRVSTHSRPKAAAVCFYRH